MGFLPTLRWIFSGILPDLAGSSGVDLVAVAAVVEISGRSPRTLTSSFSSKTAKFDSL